MSSAAHAIYEKRPGGISAGPRLQGGANMKRDHQPNTPFASAQTPLAQDLQNLGLWLSAKVNTGLSPEDVIFAKNQLLSLATQAGAVETLLFNHVRELADPLIRPQALAAQVHNPLGLALNIPIDQTDKPPLLFLCCPYSHERQSVRESRALEASRAAATLMSKGYSVFSPLSHGHHIIFTCAGAIGTDAETWAHINNSVMALCHALVLLDLNGLWNSKGCEAETRLAHELGLPINLIRIVNDGLEVEADIDSRRFYTGRL